jgi:hypothetical protein
MSVDVQVGDVNIQASDRAFYGINDAVVNVVVSASSPSNPRRDAVVAYIDLSVVSSVSNDNPGVLKFLVVAGTPAGSPADPSAGTIQTAVGGTNPYIILARIDVATSSSSVVNANITDRRNPAALAVPYLYGGASNTNGHLVPNVADDTVALLNATQTLSNKTLTDPSMTFGGISATGAWTSWTPTWTNLTVGNGVGDYKYLIVGKTVHFRLKFTLGTTSAVATGPRFSLPVNSTGMGDNDAYAIGTSLDAGIAAYYAFGRFGTSSTCDVMCGTASGSYIGHANIATTVPFTWATGDIIQLTGSYEAA